LAIWKYDDDEDDFYWSMFKFTNHFYLQNQNIKQHLLFFTSTLLFNCNYVSKFTILSNPPFSINFNTWWKILVLKYDKNTFIYNKANL
jgi:hypothetical protein